MRLLNGRGNMGIEQKPEFSIFQSIMKKDTLTALHSLHVAHLYKNSVLALGLKLDSEQAYIAGLFHDIGKIKAPDVIFSKKSPLSIKEYEMVRMHSKESFNLLKAKNIAENICEIALLHHEREDGSGYPFGISHREIPPEVKLIAIVDSFCAIIERRAYRNPESIQTAMNILYASSIKYDRKLLNSYCDHLELLYKTTLSDMYEECTVIPIQQENL